MLSIELVSLIVCLADKAAENQSLLHATIEQSGYRIKSVSNYEELQSILPEVDVLFLNLHSPIFGGLAMLRHVHRTYPDLQIIALVSPDDGPTGLDALRHGARSYISRPSDPIESLLHLRDAAERKRIQDNLNMMKHALMTIQDSVYITDMNSDIIFVNNAFCKTYGYSPDEVRGKSCKVLWKKETSEENASPVVLRSNGKRWSNEYVDVKKDGQTLLVTLTASLLKDRNGRDLATIRVTRDITERKRFEETLQRLSFLDGLTSIPNRRNFDITLRHEWKKAMKNRKPLSLIMIDIDYFKQFNDIYGHQAGDYCLKRVALEIKNSLQRSGDLVARYGGEEFAVLMPETDHEHAVDLAEFLKTRIWGLEIEHGGSSICDKLTISLGVASCVPMKDENPDSLVRIADQALYTAKNLGRNTIRSLKTTAA